AAIATGGFFLCVLLKVYWVAVIALAVTVAFLLCWAWVNGSRQEPGLEPAHAGVGLPLHYTHTAGAPGWHGTIYALIADAAVLGSLVFGAVYLWALAPGWPPPVYAELSAWVVAAALICWTLAFAGELMARRRLNATSRPDERGDAGRRCASRSSTPLPLAGLGLHTLALGVLLAVLGSTIATLPPASGHAQ